MGGVVGGRLGVKGWRGCRRERRWLVRLRGLLGRRRRGLWWRRSAGGDGVVEGDKMIQERRGKARGKRGTQGHFSEDTRLLIYNDRRVSGALGGIDAPLMDEFAGVEILMNEFWIEDFRQSGIAEIARR